LKNLKKALGTILEKMAEGGSEVYKYLLLKVRFKIRALPSILIKMAECAENSNLKILFKFGNGAR
jgi:hypothetical protein